MAFPSQITLIPHVPDPGDDKNDLARRAAAVHASGVLRALQALPVPAQEKRARLQSIIQTYTRYREQT